MAALTASTVKDVVEVKAAQRDRVGKDRPFQAARLPAAPYADVVAVRQEVVNMPASSDRSRMIPGPQAHGDRVEDSQSRCATCVVANLPPLAGVQQPVDQCRLGFGHGRMHRCSSLCLWAGFQR